MSPPKKGITPLFERLSMSVYVEYEDGKPDYSLMGNPTTIKAVDVGSVSMHDPGPYGLYRDATSTDLAKYGYVGDSIALISEVGAVMKFVSDTGFFSCQSIIDMLVDVYTFEACCKLLCMNSSDFAHPEYICFEGLTCVGELECNMLYRPIWT